jgi:hypothetical protein
MQAEKQNLQWSKFVYRFHKTFRSFSMPFSLTGIRPAHKIQDGSKFLYVEIRIQMVGVIPGIVTVEFGDSPAVD